MILLRARYKYNHFTRGNRKPNLSNWNLTTVLGVNLELLYNYFQDVLTYSGRETYPIWDKFHSTVDFRSTYMEVNSFLYINMNTDYRTKSKFLI